MQDLLRLELVLPSKRHGLRIELDRHLEAEGLALAPKLELDRRVSRISRSDWFTVLPSLAVSRQLSDGSLKAYRIVTPRITRQLVAIHLPRQPMSAAATKLIEILAEELAAAARQLQQHLIIGPD